MSDIAKAKYAQEAFLPDDFEFIGGEPEACIDSGFSSDSYWKGVRRRFFSNKGAVISLIVIAIIVFFAIVGPMISGYTYSEQNLSQKNLAPRVPGLEKLGIFNGDEKLQTTSGTKLINGYKDKGLNDFVLRVRQRTPSPATSLRVWEGARVSSVSRWSVL